METGKMVSMAFDGASTMKRLAKLIKTNLCKHALFIHCFAHCSELVFKDATKQSPLVAHAQDLCEDLYVLVGMSRSGYYSLRAFKRNYKTAMEIL